MALFLLRLKIFASTSPLLCQLWVEDAVYEKPLLLH